MLLLFVLTIFLVFPVTEAVDRKYTALQFGATFSDYISFGYDMTPFRTSLTLCSWVKRVSTSSSTPTVFHYQASSNTYEILISSHGNYNRVLGDSVLDSLESKFTTSTGQWFHYCLTGSSFSRTTQLYLDGELAASGQTSSGRELHTSGTVWFNRRGSSGSNSRVFGGQLYRFNMYTEVLSSETIKRIADGGLCAEVEETISSRQLRWEDVLAKSRSGSVVEVTGCDTGSKEFMESRLNEKEVQLRVMREQLAAVTNKLNTTEGDLVTVTSELNSTKDELQNVTGRLNQTKHELQRTKVSLESETAMRNRTEDELQRTKVSLETETGRRNRTEDELQRTQVSLESEVTRRNLTEDELQRTQVSLKSEVTRSNRTKKELNTSSAELTDSKSHLEGARRFQNITKWDILYTSSYFNEVFSEDLLEELKSSWDLMSEFVGVNITEAIVEHLRTHDVDAFECGAEISDYIYDLWGELMMNDKMMMTRGLLQHFIENHSEVPCDD